MRNIKFSLMILLGSIAWVFPQDKQLVSNIKMYSEVWDAVINKGHIDKINITHFDENVIGIMSPQNIEGIEDFKAYYNNYLTAFSDRKFTIKDIFGQGDKMVKHWNFKGKHSGDFMGIPATGEMINVEGVTLVEMKNGKIAKEQDFMDSTVFLSQLGLVSNPANMVAVQTMYDAFGKGDLPTVLAGMDENIVWNEAEGNRLADKNPYIGPEAVANGVFARVVSDHEYFNLKDIELHEMSNNQVLATLRYEGKLKKNGAEFNIQAAHLWTFKNGKAVAFQQYVDTKELADVFNKE